MISRNKHYVIWSGLCLIVSISLMSRLILSLQSNLVFVSLWKVLNPASNFSNDEQIREFANIRTSIDRIDPNSNRSERLEMIKNQLDDILNQVLDYPLLVYSDINHNDPNQSPEVGSLLEQPLYPLKLTVNEDMQILGFNVSEKAFLADGASLLTTYWEFTNRELEFELTKSTTGLLDSYVLENHIYMMEHVSNLVSNSGFEGVEMVSTFPSGFRRQYNTPYERFQLKEMERGNLRTSSLCITNDGEFIQTGFSSEPLHVVPDTYYLALAWVSDNDSGEGQALIYSTSDAGYNDVVLHYLPERDQVGPWSLRYDFVKLNQPFARFWLSNSSVSGEACFDNLLFVPITIPSVIGK